MVYIPVIVIIIVLLLLGYIYIYNKFQRLIIRINEAETNINASLNKKFDSLNRGINIIKGNIETEQEILENIIKLRSRKLNDFEMDRELDEAVNQFYILRDQYPKLEESNNFTELCQALSEAEEQLIAAKKYYNIISIKYNKLVRLFPSSFIAILCGYKENKFHTELDNMDYIIEQEK